MVTESFVVLVPCVVSVVAKGKMGIMNRALDSKRLALNYLKTKESFDSNSRELSSRFQ